MNAFTEGRSAFWEVRDRWKDNPFEVGILDHQHWDAGRCAAQCDESDYQNREAEHRNGLVSYELSRLRRELEATRKREAELVKAISEKETAP
jgi:hypothetical protein